MKKLSVIALSAMLMTAPAFAETTLNYSTNQITQQEVDLSAVFTNNQNLQVATLSEQEMKDTEGAVLPFVAATLIGGATSAWLNHGISYATTGKPASVESTIVATGTGMVSKGYSTAMLKGVGQADKVTTAVIKGNGVAVSQGTVGVYNKGKK